MNVMGREIHHRYPMRDYGYLVERSLSECNHPAERVQTKLTDRTDFKGKGLHALEYETGVS